MWNFSLAGLQLGSPCVEYHFNQNVQQDHSEEKHLANNFKELHPDQTCGLGLCHVTEATGKRWNGLGPRRTSGSIWDVLVLIVIIDKNAMTALITQADQAAVGSMQIEEDKSVMSNLL